jgi:hypothetical protein
MQTIRAIVADAYPARKAQAEAAYDAFIRLCGHEMPRVPGMDTVLRLAVRINAGRSVSEAAATEYVYRWNLALQSPVFGVPHALGL